LRQSQDNAENSLKKRWIADDLGNTLTVFGNEIETLLTGSGDDLFSVADGAALTMVLSYAGNLSSRAVTLSGAGPDGFSGSASGLGGFLNLNTFLGGESGSDRFTGLNSGEWLIQSATGGRYTSGGTTAVFDGFDDLVGGGANSVRHTGQNLENVIGGSGNDIFTLIGTQALNLNGSAGDDRFVLTNGAALAGNLDGGSRSDLVTFAAYTTARRIVLQGYASEDGFIDLDASPAPAILGLFSRINQLIGSSDLVDPDILVGPNQATLWTLGVVNTYQVNPTLTFSSFETLMGGTGVDQFNVTGSQEATLIGGAGDDIFMLNNNAQVAVINGQGGYDTILYKNFTIPVVYDRVNGTATGVASGFSSIELFGIWQPEPPAVVELFRGGNRVLKTDTALQVSFVIPACLRASLSGDFDRSRPGPTTLGHTCWRSRARWTAAARISTWNRRSSGRCLRRG
jgi:hypothetical protein